MLLLLLLWLLRMLRMLLLLLLLLLLPLLLICARTISGHGRLYDAPAGPRAPPERRRQRLHARRQVSVRPARALRLGHAAPALAPRACPLPGHRGGRLGAERRRGYVLHERFGDREVEEALVLDEQDVIRQRAAATQPAVKVRLEAKDVLTAALLVLSFLCLVWWWRRRCSLWEGRGRVVFWPPQGVPQGY